MIYISIENITLEEIVGKNAGGWEIGRQNRCHIASPVQLQDRLTHHCPYGPCVEKIKDQWKIHAILYDAKYYVFKIEFTMPQLEG